MLTIRRANAKVLAALREVAGYDRTIRGFHSADLEEFDEAVLRTVEEQQRRGATGEDVAAVAASRVIVWGGGAAIARHIEVDDGSGDAAFARELGRIWWSTTAELLARAGARVVLTGRSAESLRKVADSLPGGAEVIAADLTAPGEAKRVFETTIGHVGRLDVLVNNEGAENFTPPTRSPKPTSCGGSTAARRCCSPAARPRTWPSTVAAAS
ncbi:SDR family NAD(P)-dependent oxidoreductase [Amycolatopsis sp. DSM 110486]|uniref:SDR family NAD(P)-dependent oxidoreductase n=1 Tax=Amycolatopsis sp. DSM 110486 TaxID=2865832 RepID=UPI001C69BB50|nr:SDR family NAD(P)-dependent oxidoreductase [Amycolatopsis sp. DSM 110486]QYN23406.1 SDR family NAD(P)-dependent oxidoreductase [Amycolatopsis sp. DSM 110486]